MSHIPNTAIPHAYAKEEPDSGGLLGLVRDNPKTAMAAGAAVLAGAVAAAAIPLVKGARARSSGGKKKG